MERRCRCAIVLSMAMLWPLGLRAREEPVVKEKKPDTDLTERVTWRRSGSASFSGTAKGDSHAGHQTGEARLNLTAQISALFAGGFALYFAPQFAVTYSRTASVATTEDSEEGEASHVANLVSPDFGSRLILGAWRTRNPAVRIPTRVDQVMIGGPSVLFRWKVVPTGSVSTSASEVPGETIAAWVQSALEGSLGLGWRLDAPTDRAVSSPWYRPVEAYVHLGLLGGGSWIVPHTHRSVIEEENEEGEVVRRTEERKEESIFTASRPTFVLELRWQWRTVSFTFSLDRRGLPTDFAGWNHLQTTELRPSIGYKFSKQWVWNITGSYVREHARPGDVHAYPEQGPEWEVATGPTFNW